MHHLASLNLCQGGMDFPGIVGLTQGHIFGGFGGGNAEIPKKHPDIYRKIYIYMELWAPDKRPQNIWLSLGLFHPTYIYTCR